MKTRGLLAVLLLQMISGAVVATQTALDRYVAKPDLNYGFYRYHSESKPLYTTYFLRMTSQQWRTPYEVDRPVWRHNLAITLPRVTSAACRETAILIINGGNNDSPPPRDTHPLAAQLAQLLGCTVSIAGQIPNQPLGFRDEQPSSRSEDAIIAYSFNQFMNTGDEEWPLLLPMAKAAVRAMDTVQGALATKSIRIRNFILYGGSKRGWTAWLTAAVDPRVRAVIPASIDLLNLAEQFRHHCEAYGFYTDAVRDYVAFDIPNRTQTLEGTALAAIVDPYAYRDRYLMPKLVLNAAGDQYFPPDSSQLYFQDLPGLKWVRYTPNVDHAQSSAGLLSAVTWAKKILEGKPPPQFSWAYSAIEGAIRVQTATKPSRVKLWQAGNPNARDFRLQTIGSRWTASRLYDLGGGRYFGRVAPPPNGWTAFFVELTYPSSNRLEPAPVYTTDVYVTPDVLPYTGRRCEGEIPAPNP